MPIPSMLASNEDVTGSIPVKPVSPLSPALDAEDWRRAKAAMGVALDPQGNGELVNWDNSQTKARGSFTPIAGAYPTDAKVCRAFLANVSTASGENALQGTACVDKTGDWTIADIKPFKKS